MCSVFPVVLVPWREIKRGAAIVATSSFLLAGATLSGAETPVIRSIQQFWDVPQELRNQAYPFDIECDVTFFDPGWRMLWIQDRTGAAYVPIGDQLPTVEPGRHIRATGTFHPPIVDISFADAEITVISDAQVEPRPVGTQLEAVGQFTNRVVTVEALVDHQTQTDPTHLQLFLSTGGRMIYGRVLTEPGKPAPQLADAFVRVRAVYNARLTPAGQLASLELMVARLDDVEVIDRLVRDARFNLPVTPISDLAARPIGRPVRIVGLVKAQEPGRLLRLRDESGQIDLLTAQTRLCSINEPVEAIGFPAINGTEWKLREAYYRPFVAGADQPATSSAEMRPIRVSAQVLELSTEEAMRGHPVSLSGVVTWSHPDAPFFFVHDGSGGICVQRGKDTSKVRPPGRNVEVVGTTAMGDFAPVVVSTQTTKLGDLMPPEARQVSLEHALTGVEEAQWVEMRGYLRRIRGDGPWSRLEIATSAGDFTAVLPADEPTAGLTGSVVRLHGVCTASADGNRRLTGITLWVPSAGFVQIEDAAPADIFDTPERSLASLGRFGTLQSFNRRVKVSGVVLHHAPGHSFYIQEDEASLLVLSSDTTVLAPGVRVEAVGFLGRHQGRVALREAIYRTTGSRPQPPVTTLAHPAALTPERDGHLVQVEGLLIDEAATGEQHRLTLQAESVVFEALLDVSAGHDAPTTWQPGSRLALTGVYEIEPDENGRPKSFHLRLRSPADVLVVRYPSWFTPARILTFTGALTLVTLGIVAWVVALRRRVQLQTGQIREQLQREARLQDELQRASRLESLGVLAGGIAHDFNNLLTVVMGNVSLAQLDPAVRGETNRSLDEAKQAVRRARDLTQQLLTFAKGGAPVRSAVALPEIVREVTQFVVHGSAVRCNFDIPAGLWIADVDKSQISQVVQNIALNGVQAMPDGGALRVTLRNEEIHPGTIHALAPGRYLKLSIADDGHGIPADILPRIFDPYFSTKTHGSGIGLATAHSIVQRHHGHISVESTPGTGTTFHLWLPAAAVPDAPVPVAAPRPPAQTSQGRVLLMDDEESIRRLCVLLLARCGFTAHAVADGTEALHEYERARTAGEPYDVVILDLTVPGGLGGRQTMERLVQIDPDVRAIVASGYSHDPVMANFRAHGFRAVVAKPFELAQLKQAILDLLVQAPV